MILNDLDPAIFALQAFLFGLVAAYSTRHTFNGDSDVADRTSQAVSGIIIKIFLPLLVFEAIVNNLDSIVGYIGHFFLGFSVALMLYVITRIIFRKAKSELKYTSLLVSTFGGGNRGVALMSLIVSLMTSLTIISVGTESDKMLSAFIFLDLGNFFFFLTLFPHLIKRQKKMKALT